MRARRQPLWRNVACVVVVVVVVAVVVVVPKSSDLKMPAMVPAALRPEGCVERSAQALPCFRVAASAVHWQQFSTSAVLVVNVVKLVDSVAHVVDT